MALPKSDLDNADRVPGSVIAGERGVDVSELIIHGELTTGTFIGWTVIGKRKSHVADIAVREAAGAPRILRAINCHDDLLQQVKLLEKTIEYSIRRSNSEGDDEGARLQSFTLYLVRESIARAEGRPALAEARAA